MAATPLQIYLGSGNYTFPPNFTELNATNLLNFVNYVRERPNPPYDIGPNNLSHIKEIHNITKNGDNIIITLAGSALVFKDAFALMSSYATSLDNYEPLCEYIVEKMFNDTDAGFTRANLHAELSRIVAIDAFTTTKFNVPKVTDLPFVQGWINGAKAKATATATTLTTAANTAANTPLQHAIELESGAATAAEAAITAETAATAAATAADISTFTTAQPNADIYLFTFSVKNDIHANAILTLYYKFMNALPATATKAIDDAILAAATATPVATAVSAVSALALAATAVDIATAVAAAAVNPPIAATANAGEGLDVEMDANAVIVVLNAISTNPNPVDFMPLLALVLFNKTTHIDLFDNKAEAFAFIKSSRFGMALYRYLTKKIIETIADNNSNKYRTMGGGPQPSRSSTLGHSKDKVRRKQSKRQPKTTRKRYTFK